MIGRRQGRRSPYADGRGSQRLIHPLQQGLPAAVPVQGLERGGDAGGVHEWRAGIEAALEPAERLIDLAEPDVS
jgi:hypothetical protein